MTLQTGRESTRLSLAQTPDDIAAFALAIASIFVGALSLELSTACKHPFGVRVIPRYMLAERSVRNNILYIMTLHL